MKRVQIGELRYIESVFFFLHNTFLGHSSRLHYVKYRAKESSSMIQLYKNSNKVFHCHWMLYKQYIKQMAFAIYDSSRVKYLKRTLFIFHFLISLRRELFPKSFSEYNPLSTTNILQGVLEQKFLQVDNWLCGPSKRRKKDFLARELLQKLSFKWQVLVTQGKQGSHQPRTLRKINFAKQNLHGGISSCSACGICFQKLKKTHRQFIISVFTRSIIPPFTSTNGASEVAKNGVSFDSSISLLHKFLGASKWTVSPSRACRNSAQAMILGYHRKSLRYITSASSAPIQANEPVAGFENAW